MSIASNLKNYRKLSSLNQEQVAAALGIDRSTYSYYETGKSVPGIGTLIKLAAMYGVELYTLIDYNSDSSFHGDNISYNAGSSFKGDNISYFSKFDRQLMPVNRLFKEEQDLIMIYRQLSENDRNELKKRAKSLLEKQLASEE